MSQAPQADAELLAFIANLDAEFGKKPKRESNPAHVLNRAFHANNPQLGKSSGKAPERLDPENSSHWRPIQRITYMVRQGCRCCGDWVDFVGGEYIKFESIFPYGGNIVKRADHLADMWLMYSIEEPLEDVIEWQAQQISRCAGCIQVERQAVEIWESALEQQREHMKQLPLLDITQPFQITQKGPHSQEITIEIEGEVK